VNFPATSCCISPLYFVCRICRSPALQDCLFSAGSSYSVFPHRVDLKPEPAAFGTEPRGVEMAFSTVDFSISDRAVPDKNKVVILFRVGSYFRPQAKVDSRLFDPGHYSLPSRQMYQSEARRFATTSNQKPFMLVGSVVHHKNPRMTRILRFLDSAESLSKSAIVPYMPVDGLIIRRRSQNPPAGEGKQGVIQRHGTEIFQGRQLGVSRANRQCRRYWLSAKLR